jgi:tetratricopeptide (TPR) repeat protein
MFRANSARMDGDYFYFTKHDDDSAVISYFDSVKMNPYDPAPWYSLWNVYMNERKFDAANVVIGKAIALFPENGILYGAQASTYEELINAGNSDKTASSGISASIASSINQKGFHDALVNNIKYFPANSLTTYVKLVEFDFKQKKYDEALAYINKVVPIYSHYESVLWYVMDPNSPVMSANLKILKDYKVKIEKVTNQPG